ncbi:MAG: hypothetical protein A3F92_00455 [Candidatus Rokubacteria bacterium RIFCSPLOWO2_12_FULL_71_22]|nr:MAG: hypothetical protein A3F92_00455 [Candidatus Rokubacteria bacterium RIFCSPLOWO2_12_FULL_71_22]
MRRDDGFTLAELLVACAIIAFVMAGLLVMLQSGQQSYLVGSNQVEAQQNVRVALERMIREIRGAGYCPNCSGTPPFTAIASQSTTGFTIQNDWDGSATISTSGTVTDYAGTTHGEQVIYAVSGGALTRQEIGLDGSPVTLASGICVVFTNLGAASPAATLRVTSPTTGRTRDVVVSASGQVRVQ